MSTTTAVRAGQGSDIDPNGWQSTAPQETEMSIQSTIRAGVGARIDDNGWRGKARWTPPPRSAPAPAGASTRTERAGHEHDHEPPRQPGRRRGPERVKGWTGEQVKEMNMNTHTHVRAGKGYGADPNGWREMVMSTITNLRAGKGAGIDPNGWRRRTWAPSRTSAPAREPAWTPTDEGDGDEHHDTPPCRQGHGAGPQRVKETAMSTTTRLHAGKGMGVDPNG